MEISKSQNFSIKVFDVIGKVIYQENLNKILGKYQKSIDMSKNAKGTYFLQIISSEGTINRKIVLQ